MQLNKFPILHCLYFRQILQCCGKLECFYRVRSYFRLYNVSVSLKYLKMSQLGLNRNLWGSLVLIENMIFWKYYLDIFVSTTWYSFRGVFRTLSNIYNAPFLQTWFRAKRSDQLFLQKAILKIIVCRCLNPHFFWQYYPNEIWDKCKNKCLRKS